MYGSTGHARIHNSWVRFSFSLYPQDQTSNSDVHIIGSNILAGIREMLNGNNFRFSQEPINRPEADPFNPVQNDEPYISI